MQKHLISLAFCLMFAIAAKCDTVSFSFQVDGGEVRYGNVERVACLCQSSDD